MIEGRGREETISNLRLLESLTAAIRPKADRFIAANLLAAIDPKRSLANNKNPALGGALRSKNMTS